MTSVDRVVLVVEDNADDVMLLRRAFRKANLDTPLQIVCDGDQAIAYLSGEAEYGDRSQYPLPVLLLLDLKLPRRSGIEVLQWMRQQPLLKRLPVVVLTSSLESTDVARAYDCGANSYLQKPVDFDALLNLVKHVNLYWMVMNTRPSVTDESEPICNGSQSGPDSV